MPKAYRGCRAPRATTRQLNGQPENEVNRCGNKGRCRECPSSFILEKGGFGAAAGYIRSFRYGELRPLNLGAIAERLPTVGGGMGKELYNRQNRAFQIRRGAGGAGGSAG